MTTDKILLSGLIVDSDKYYKLLEWKDTNISKFSWFCAENGINVHSINHLTQEQYNLLLDVANI